MKNILQSKLLFFIIISTTILALNLTPLIMHVRHAPPGRTFAMIHNNAQDFFFYLSLMNEGANGSWLIYDPFTSEKHESSIIFAYFTWAGKLSKLLSLPYTITYHAIRILSGFALLAAAFYFLLKLKIPHTRLTFFFFVFAAPLTHLISDINGIRKVPFMYWWTGVDPIRRAAYLPHHMIGGLFLILSITAIVQYLNQPNRKTLLLLIIMALILAFVHTPSLLILLLILPPTVIIYLIANHFSIWKINLIALINLISKKALISKIKKWAVGISLGQLLACAGRNSNVQNTETDVILIPTLRREKNPNRLSIFNGILQFIPILHRDSLRMTFKHSSFQFPVSNIIGLLGYWVIGLLLMLLMVSQTTRGFPWSQYLDWEKNLQFPLTKEYFGALGILFPFALIGTLVSLVSKRFERILLACWFIIPILIIPFASQLKISNIRLIQGVPYLPLAILAVIGIYTIQNYFNMLLLKPKSQAQSASWRTKSKIIPNDKNPETDVILIPTLRREKNPNRLSIFNGILQFIPILHRDSLRMTFKHSSFQFPVSNIIGLLGYWVIGLLFIYYSYPTFVWSIKDQIREYWPIFGNVYFDDRLNNAFQYINLNFPPKTITLSTFYAGNYLPAFTNTVSFIGHFGYTYNVREKEPQVIKFFENKMTKEDAKDFLLNNKIALIFQGPEEKPLYNNYLYPDILKPVYDRPEATIYEIIK